MCLSACRRVANQRALISLFLLAYVSPSFFSVSQRSALYGFAYGFTCNVQHSLLVSSRVDASNPLSSATNATIDLNCKTKHYREQAIEGSSSSGWSWSCSSCLLFAYAQNIVSLSIHHFSALGRQSPNSQALLPLVSTPGTQTEHDK